jgi:hypothetical protein
VLVLLGTFDFQELQYLVLTPKVQFSDEVSEVGDSFAQVGYEPSLVARVIVANLSFSPQVRATQVLYDPGLPAYHKQGDL